MSEIPTQRFTLAEIAEILPQSDPFMFLDSAESARDEMRADYRVRGDEFFLKGHFKNEPVFPASIVFEALGQVACLWLLVNAQARFGAALTAGHVFFASMDGAHFYRRVGPGETFVMKVKLAQARAPLAVFRGTVTTPGGERVAEIERLVLAFTLDEKEPKAT